MFRAKHVKIGLPLAIKVLRINDKEQRQQLANEIRIGLREQATQHIITVYGGYYEKEMVHLVMEYMDLGSLRAFTDTIKMKNQGFFPLVPEKFIREIMERILYGVKRIHDRKSVHRDIKPENILVNTKGEIKVSDFGISKILQDTIAKTYIGTFRYMAPERHTPQMDYDFPADIWSVGNILYELITGTIPYEGLTEMSISVEVSGGSIPMLPNPEFLSKELLDFYN